MEGSRASGRHNAIPNQGGGDPQRTRLPAPAAGLARLCCSAGGGLDSHSVARAGCSPTNSARSVVAAPSAAIVPARRSGSECRSVGGAGGRSGRNASNGMAGRSVQKEVGPWPTGRRRLLDAGAEVAGARTGFRRWETRPKNGRPSGLPAASRPSTAPHGRPRGPARGMRRTQPLARRRRRWFVRRSLLSSSVAPTNTSPSGRGTM